MTQKEDLLARAKELGVKVSHRNTMPEIQAAIDTAGISMAEAEIVKEEKREATVAKAGRRSRKAIAEVEAEIEKEERKAAGDTTALNPEAEQTMKKGPSPVSRPKIERRGKKYREAAGKVEKGKVYGLTEALELATQTSPSKFDASVELHLRLGVDPRQADQNVRATVVLPNGTGRTVRVAVFAPESEHAKAKDAGADIVGDEDFLKQLEAGTLNFDILVATPQFMPRLGKYARVLGPRGLMPNPKSGTVSADVAKAVRESKAGKVEYRVDKQAQVHLSIGKVSFGAKQLEENARVFFDSLNAQRPGSLKGVYVKGTSLSTTHGPGIKIENVVS